MKTRIAVLQFDVHVGEPRRNEEKAEELIASAAALGARILVLPELWQSGYDLENAGNYTDDEAVILERLEGIAREKKLVLFAGSLLHRQDGKIRNTMTVLSPGSRSSYSKLHLFRLMDEDRFLEQGDVPVLMPTPWGPAGLAICYDLRFPELFRHYALAGARLVVIPAEWPAARIEHWKTLLRARAIENQLFVVGANRCGESGNRKNDQKTLFGGASAIIDPWGEVLAEGGAGEGVLLAELDWGKIEEARSRIPVFDDRRTDLY